MLIPCLLVVLVLVAAWPLGCLLVGWSIERSFRSYNQFACYDCASKLEADRADLLALIYRAPTGQLICKQCGKQFHAERRSC